MLFLLCDKEYLHVHLFKYTSVQICFGFCLAFDFCRFCVVIRFFHPRHNGQWPTILKDFYTRYYPLHYFLILIPEKEPVLPFSMLGRLFREFFHYKFTKSGFCYDLMMSCGGLCLSDTYWRNLDTKTRSRT